MADVCALRSERRQRRREVVLGFASLASLVAGRAMAQAAPAAVLRVVTIGGALTEIVYRLGAESLLVGTDTTSLYPEAAQKLPKVGYARSLSAEGVLSLRPTLVIANADAGPPAVIAQLREADVRIVRADAGHSFEGLLRNVQLVADAIGRPEAGRLLGESVTARWHEVSARIVSGPHKPRVLFILSHVATNVQVAGAGTAAHSIIEAAGAVNALEGFKGYRPLTAEAAVASAPEFILTTSQGAQAVGGVDRLLTFPGLALTPAGRARRVLVLDALYLLGGGPRMTQAVADVARFVGTMA